MESIVRDIKDIKGRKDASEIGIVTSIKPFAFTINGVEYSSENFVIYLPAVDRIKQWEEIRVETQDPNPHLVHRVNKGLAFVDIGDLELEPDQYERRFIVGDLIDVTDRGDSFIVHGRLVKIGEEKEIHPQVHRQ